MPSSHLPALSVDKRHPPDGNTVDHLMIFSFFEATYILVFFTASDVIRRALLEIMVSADVSSVFVDVLLVHEVDESTLHVHVLAASSSGSLIEEIAGRGRLFFRRKL